jgi:hypothetical protein
MSIRSAAWIAWSLCVLCVALATASQILALLNGRTLAEIFIAGSIITFAILTVSFSVVGALIISHRPENSIGWIFLAVGFLYGLLSAGDEYAIYALLTNPGALPWGAEASWLGQWIWAPGLGLVLVFLPLLFPDGHPPSYRWRWVAWLGGLSIGVAVVSSTILLWPERGPALVTGDENPSHVVQVLVVFVALPMMLLAGLGAVISLLVRFRRARGDEQQQIKWFAFAAALTFVWILVIEVFGELLSIEGGVPEAILAFTLASASLVIPSIPIATGIAILRYRLYDIDRIINRTLVYGSLTATLVALYFGGIVVLQRIFVILTGQQSTLAVVASTLLIAALFTPLRRRIQSFIDRRFYRRKYDARKTLEAFSAKLRDETDLEALNNDLVGVVRETMQPAHVSLWLRPDTPRKGEQAG